MTHEQCAVCSGRGRECEHCDGHGETGHPRRFTRARLAELQAAKLPRLAWADLLKWSRDTPPPEKDAADLTEYFSQFVKSPGRCVCCEQPFTAGILDFRSDASRLEWGMTNGEAHCDFCRYPYRVLHRNAGPISLWAHGLPYHPEDLSFPEKK